MLCVCCVRSCRGCLWCAGKLHSSTLWSSEADANSRPVRLQASLQVNETYLMALSAGGDARQHNARMLKV